MTFMHRLIILTNRITAYNNGSNENSGLTKVYESLAFLFSLYLRGQEKMSKR